MSYEQIVAVAGSLLFFAGTVGLFLVKDVYTKVGEVPALKERIKSLEASHEDSKKANEIVYRLEERLKDLSNKVDLLLAAMLNKEKQNNNA